MTEYYIFGVNYPFKLQQYHINISHESVSVTLHYLCLSWGTYLCVY